MTVTKEMTISQVLEINQGAAGVFMAFGMHCLGCPSARGETLEDACEVHGADADELVDLINDYLAGKE